MVVSLEAALLSLLGYVPREVTDDDLFAAGAEAQRRRQKNSEEGAAVFDALSDRGVPWRVIGDRTGVPKSTAQRWGTKPPSTDDENDEGGTP